MLCSYDTGRQIPYSQQLTHESYMFLGMVQYNLYVYSCKM